MPPRLWAYRDMSAGSYSFFACRHCTLWSQLLSLTVVVCLVLEHVTLEILSELERLLDVALNCAGGARADELSG
jgi:hypothetical protein